MQRLFFLERRRIVKVLSLFGVLAIIAVSAAWAAVTLLNFEGRWQSNYVVLDFSTGSELDHAGFHVWRSEINLAPDEVNRETATRLTNSLIVGGPCQPSGFDYQYVDTTVDPMEDVYYYYLESTGCSGSAPQFYGAPDSNGGLRVVHSDAPEFENKVYAPLIVRDSIAPIPTPMPMPTLTPTPLIWPTSTPEPTASVIQ